MAFLSMKVRPRLTVAKTLPQRYHLPFRLYQRSIATEFKLDLNSGIRERYFIEVDELFRDLCLRNGADQKAGGY